MALSYSILNNKSSIKSDYLEEVIYNLLDQTFEIPQIGFSFNVLMVDKEYIARPDLISLDAYGDTQYADVICKLNGISNPFELNEGMEILIPTMESVGYFQKQPGKYDKEDFNEFDNVTKSVRNTKRKANEALIGDSRFRIDPAAGLIIY